MSASMDILCPEDIKSDAEILEVEMLDNFKKTWIEDNFKKTWERWRIDYSIANKSCNSKLFKRSTLWIKEWHEIEWTVSPDRCFFFSQATARQWSHICGVGAAERWGNSPFCFTYKWNLVKDNQLCTSLANYLPKLSINGFFKKFNTFQVTKLEAQGEWIFNPQYKNMKIYFHNLEGLKTDSKM